jgi:hypothetical protein
LRVPDLIGEERRMANLEDAPHGIPEIGEPEDWERIEEALGYKAADPSRRERLCRDLRRISDQYFGVGRMPQVRARNVDRALSVLRGHTTALQAYLWWGRTPAEIKDFKDLLKAPDEPPQPPDDGLDDLDQWAMFYVGSEIMPPERRQALLDLLAELSAAVDAANRVLPVDKGGRPRNRELHSLIYELSRYYERHTGKKPGLPRGPDGKPSGPFFRFVETVLRVLVPDQVRSDDALYSQIKRTLKIKHWQQVPAWPLCSLIRTKTPIQG